jgi:hypothetical protein
MDLWGIDLVGVRVRGLSGGQRGPKVLTGIDDHSRFCVAATVMEHEHSAAVVAALRGALAEYGAPDAILTDNGKVFTDRFNSAHGETAFDRTCREAGITHHLTGPYHPQTNGKVERFHGTLRRELLAAGPFGSLAEAQTALDTFRDHYNTRRPMTYDHSPVPTPDQPPVVRFSQPRRHNETRAPLELARVAAANVANGHFSTRLIASTGMIGWRNRLLLVDRRLAGSTVAVVEITDVVHVFLGHRLVATAAAPASSTG